MTSILKSTMETYLFDDEVELETVEQWETQEVEQRTQYPQGFFSSL